MVEKYAELISTQLTLKERLESDPSLPHGYSVMADVQTAGRGRGDHSWVSVSGNLHASILIRNLPFQEITWIPHWVSTCVLRALINLGVDGSLIQLKWPNDLWVERTKKIAGILCEKKGDVVVMGIGLNLVNSPDAMINSSLNYGVVPCEGLKATEVLEKILEQLSTSISVSEIREFYEQHGLFRKGDHLEWIRDLDKVKIHGFFEKLGAHGELLVDVDSKIMSLYTEDVRVVKIIKN